MNKLVTILLTGLVITTPLVFLAIPKPEVKTLGEIKMNPDYRGWLQQTGNSWALPYVGNDYNTANYGINTPKLYSDYYYTYPGSGPNPNYTQDNDPYYQAAHSKLVNLAKQYGGVAQSLLGANTGGGSSDYDLAIGNTQSAINRLPGQQSAQESNIKRAYQNALDQLLSGKNRAQEAYGTSKLQTGQEYVSGKNTIGSQAGTSLSGLLRLLGSRGAGGGSAYQFTAPEAVARGATLQRSELGQTFGRNMGALDTNWNNYLTDYGNSVRDVGLQRGEQVSTLEDTIRTNRASLLQTLAQLTAAKTGNIGNATPYINQANALLDRVGLYRQPAMNYNVKAYNAPDLAQYTSSSISPTYQGQQASNDYFSPYLQALLGKKTRTGLV